MNKLINYCKRKLPYKLKFESMNNVIEAYGQKEINETWGTDFFVFIVEKKNKTFLVAKLIGDKEGWMNKHIYYSYIPTITLAKRILKLKIEEWKINQIIKNLKE